MLTRSSSSNDAGQVKRGHRESNISHRVERSGERDQRSFNPS